MDEFDIIIIGSGGVFSTAMCLARARQEFRIIEQYSVVDDHYVGIAEERQSAH